MLFVVSNFFRLKIAAYERRNEDLKFNYEDFDRSTIQLFLDTVYKIDNVDQLDISSLLKLAEFLKWEGKNVFSDSVLTYTDLSNDLKFDSLIKFVSSSSLHIET